MREWEHQKAMKEKKNLNLNLMFDQACAFVDCAKFTESEKYKIECRTNSHGYVDISLSALACEIFIKCLIIHKGGTYNQEHALVKLWNIYKELDASNSALVEESLLSWFNSKDPEMFGSMINDASIAFIQWRYVFDYESSDGVKVNSQFLRGFRAVLRNLCCQSLHGHDWEEH